MTRLLKLVALALVLAFVGWAVYDNFFAGVAPGDRAELAGDRAFEDGAYERAEAAYRAALAEDPMHLAALRGLARSLHLQGKHDRALATYDEAIAHAPDFAATYANRGILLETMERREEALADYMRALELDPELADGSSWLTRFLRDQPEAPPTIADRASHLRAELAKPQAERVLRIPEIDARQRPEPQ